MQDETCYTDLMLFSETQTHAMTSNILANIPQRIPDELFETLIHTPHVKIERIISHGHQTDANYWYDQPQAEWVLLVKGAATLAFEDHTLDLQTGDYVNIPAHCKHRVAWTTPDEETVWLAIFYDE